MSLAPFNVFAVSTSAANSTKETPIVSKSAYAQYLETKNVTGIGVYWPNDLITQMDKATQKAGFKKRTEWLHAIAIDAVNAAGFTYSAPVKARAESKDEIIARMQREMEELKAKVAAAPLVPTPPTQMADPSTGALIQKAS